MKTDSVFSYIVQRRYSRDYENIATDALAFILDSSEPARSGLMKLLRGIAPDLPSLRFRTQHGEDNARPDMEGHADNVRRAFIENKFWAGLTENQPVHYLKLLAGNIQPSVLLVVVPTARQETVWRELLRRLENDKGRDVSKGDVRSITTGTGPILALTSWAKLLSAIEAELVDSSQARNDVGQLRALCDAADNQAFVPLAPEQLTDQQTPAFFLQLNAIREGAVEKAITAGVLSIKNPLAKNPKQGQLLPQSSWKRFGRYVCFPSASGVGAWLGTELTLWKDHGATPLWLVFEDSKWQRGSEVRTVLAPWASSKQISTVWRRNDDGADEFAVGIGLVTGQEEEAVVTCAVERLKEIASELSKIERKQ